MLCATLHNVLASDTVASVLPVLLDATCKGTALILLATLATLGMRRASAAARHLVWATAMLWLLTLPVLSAVLPAWQVLPWQLAALAAPTQEITAQRDEVLSATAAGLPELLPPKDPAGTVPGGIHTGDPQPESHPEVPPVLLRRSDAAEEVADGRGSVLPAQPDAFWPLLQSALKVGWQRWAVVVWALGFLLALLPMAVAVVSLWRLRRLAVRVVDGPWAALLKQSAQRLGVRRRVELLRSQSRQVPMHWGIWRPRLLLPAAAGDWPLDRLRVAVLHELAHVRRSDCLTQTLARAAAALYWFHPLVWAAMGRMRSEREAACDDLMVQSGCRPASYAEHLLQIASQSRPNVLAAAGSIAMARRSQMEGRILKILDPGRNRRAVGRRAVWLAVALSAATVIPVAMMQAQQAPKPTVRAGDELEVRLIGVRPDEGDEVFDRDGNLIGREVNYGVRGHTWRDEEMPREFLIETSLGSPPVRWLDTVWMRLNGDPRPYGPVWVVQIQSPRKPTRITLPAVLPRTYKDTSGRDVRLDRVDFTLPYYRGPRGPADCRFSGPFEVGQTVRDDDVKGFALLTRSPRVSRDRITTLRFQLQADRRLAPGIPLIAYDAGGKWHLARGLGGPVGDGRSELSYTIRGMQLEEVVAVTFNEKPHQKTFRNVVVHYPDRPRRNHAAFLDPIAERLGMQDADPKSIIEYQYKSAEEALSCLDLARGEIVTGSVSLPIRDGRPAPELTPNDFSETQLKRLRAAAGRWLTSVDSGVQQNAVQLGLWGGWPEFSEPAIAMLHADHSRSSRHFVARALSRYCEHLTAEQIRQLQTIVLEEKDRNVREYLFGCFASQTQSAAAIDALLQLAQCDKVWVWQLAIHRLWWKHQETGRPRLEALAAESPRLHCRMFLTLGPKKLPNISESQRAEAYRELPELLTATCLYMDFFRFRNLYEEMVERVDRRTATATMDRLLREVLDDWEFLSNHSTGSCKVNVWAVSGIVRRLNYWYDLDLGGVGKGTRTGAPNQPHDWKAVAAEAVRWYKLASALAGG